MMGFGAGLFAPMRWPGPHPLPGGRGPVVLHGRQGHSAIEITSCGSWDTEPIEHRALSDPGAAVISIAFKPFTRNVADAQRSSSIGHGQCSGFVTTRQIGMKSKPQI